MSFRVFKGEKQLVVIDVAEDGRLFVYDESISPLEMKEVGSFEADGVSDFNWGMVNTILRHGQPGPELDEAKKIAKEGL